MASMYYTEPKLKNKNMQGRPGNEANTSIVCIHYVIACLISHWIADIILELNSTLNKSIIHVPVFGIAKVCTLPISICESVRSTSTTLILTFMHYT